MLERVCLNLSLQIWKNKYRRPNCTYIFIAVQLNFEKQIIHSAICYYHALSMEESVTSHPGNLLIAACVKEQMLTLPSSDSLDIILSSCVKEALNWPAGMAHFFSLPVYGFHQAHKLREKKGKKNDHVHHGVKKPYYSHFLDLNFISHSHFSSHFPAASHC